MCLYGKVTANDDNGLSVEVARVERDDTEAEPEAAADAGGEEDAEADDWRQRIRHRRAILGHQLRDETPQTDGGDIGLSKWLTSNF